MASAAPPPLPKAKAVAPVRKAASAETLTTAGAGAAALLSRAAVVTVVTQRLSVVWDVPVGTNVIKSYRLYKGPASRTYTNTTVCTTNAATVLYVRNTAPVFLAVTAVDNQSLESDYSNEIRWPALPKTNLVITVSGRNLSVSTNGLAGPWKSVTYTNLTFTNRAPFSSGIWLWRGNKVTITNYWSY